MSPSPSTLIGEVNGTSLNTNETLSMSNLTAGQYYWQLRAVNSDNVISLSAIQTFTVCVNTPPK